MTPMREAPKAWSNRGSSDEGVPDRDSTITKRPPKMALELMAAIRLIEIARAVVLFCFIITVQPFLVATLVVT
jgi:hypothetical protein